MVQKSDGATIGFCGLQPLGIGLRNEVEIGWWLAQRCWGQGLATEAARSVMEYAFRSVGLERVIAIAQPENGASRRVMEKIGMQYESRARAQRVSRRAVRDFRRQSVEWKAANKLCVRKERRKAPPLRNGAGYTSWFVGRRKLMARVSRIVGDFYH